MRRGWFVAGVSTIVAALLASFGTHAVPARFATPTCHLSDLRIVKGTQRRTTGHFHLAIVFVNRSHHVCTLRGFPGVLSVGSHFDQLGDAATWDRSLPTVTVVLHPGGRAHADYTQTDANLFDPMDCQPVRASALEVYPPGSPGFGPGKLLSGYSAYLPWSRLACTGHRASSVRPVRPGPG